jgi:outer membrane protein TolC
MLRARLLVAAGALLVLAAEAASVGIAVNLDTVMQLAYERNTEILTARERVHESQIALDAALQSCMPEMFRKDTFKTPVAEATVWRRRDELRKVETGNLQDAANTYFNWLTALRGVEVSRDLLEKEQKLLGRVSKLAASERPVQVVVEAVETSVNGQQQNILHTQQQIGAAATKLAYLMGINDGILTPTETLVPINRVDTSVPLEALVRQAQENGPGVRELQGLIASIQQGIADAYRAQRCCCRTGAPLICGRLQIAQSQLQQAQSSLVNTQLKLRAGVEDAFTAVLSGLQEIEQASKAIKHAKETNRIMELRETQESPQERVRNKTYDGVLNSIRQLSQAYSNYLTAVSDYNKAQMRLLILLGTYANNCPPPAAP